MVKPEERQVAIWEATDRKCPECNTAFATDGNAWFQQCDCEVKWKPAAVMFSSKSDDHATPQNFFDKLNKEFRFTLDVCASVANRKCERFYTIENDGLRLSWDGSVWMNPPYGRTIGQWVKKARESARDNNATVVCLLPSRTDTAWFHDYVLPYAEIRFVRGRLKFGSASNSAPFPSIVAIFRPLNGCNIIPSPKAIPANP